jgi:hypothetical protein
MAPAILKEEQDEKENERPDRSLKTSNRHGCIPLRWS